MVLSSRFPKMFLLLFCALVASGELQASKQRWSQRGLFALGDLVFDFHRELWLYGPVASQLTDCSNAAFYCAKSDFMSVVLPRQCPSPMIGTTWRHAGLSTTVIAVELRNQPPPLPPRDVYLLVDADHNNVLYEYDPPIGIAAIYFDFKKQVDLRTAATTGNVQQVRRQGLYFPITTPDPFGACDTRN